MQILRNSPSCLQSYGVLPLWLVHSDEEEPGNAVGVANDADVGVVGGRGHLSVERFWLLCVLAIQEHCKSQIDR